MLNNERFYRFLTRILIIPFVILLFSPFTMVLAQDEEVVPPVVVANYGNSGATLAIPRWKGYMSETNPDNFWLAFATSSTAPANIKYTTDAGATWSPGGLLAGETGSMNYHASLFGRANTLYITWPGGSSIYFRKINPPAHDNADRDPLRIVPGASGEHRSSVTVDGNGRIWVFTRLSATPSENVRYHYSDDGGANWTNGVAVATGADHVRIGSMPYIDGRAALVVFYMYSARGYEYYVWNGTSFEAMPDHAIYPVAMGEVRVFTHNVINDTTFHMIFGLGFNLIHVWKHYQGGNGSWTSQIIDSSPYTEDNDWFTASTVRGGRLYLFYLKKASSDASSTQVMYKRWDQATMTWTAPVLVSGQITANHDPNTCFSVPTTANYIPVFWSSEESGLDIYFAKILLQDQPEIDTIPPAAIEDLGNVTGPDQGVLLSYRTAPGYNGIEALADDYHNAHQPEIITDHNWDSDFFIIDPAIEGAAEGNLLTGAEQGRR
ncbi:MAG: hypothetical protein A2W25_10210 [candidate division Zixibacteria bacterium RBG_16_53_22]|nr:MAG: hypothetical protein A2W25_10210 [candidate division Zixibacteria bacterium RBG_16_53_22]